MNDAFIWRFFVYCCTPKALYNHVWGGGSHLNSHQCAASTWMMWRHPQDSPHTSYRWRGERVIEPIKCMRSPHTSYRWRGERVIEPIKCMRSPHTSYRWRGERVIEPIKCMRSPHTSYRWRGERVIETIKCMRTPHTSYRWRGERVIEPIKCMRSPHTSCRWRGERVTPATGGERERDVETIKCIALTTHQLHGEERES